MNKQRLMELAGVSTENIQLNEQNEVQQAVETLAAQIASEMVEWMQEDPEALEELKENPDIIATEAKERFEEEFESALVQNVTSHVKSKLQLN